MIRQATIPTVDATAPIGEWVERWRPVAGWEDRFMISDLGRVLSLPQTTLCKSRLGNLYRKQFPARLLSVGIGNHGYPVTNLWARDGKAKRATIHRLIAVAFIPNPENKPDVNHKNGIKRDFRIENLEWVTTGENVRHGYRTLGHKMGFKSRSVKGIRHPMAKLDDDKVRAIRAEHAAGISLWNIARANSVSKKLILQIVHKKLWTHVT